MTSETVITVIVLTVRESPGRPGRFQALLGGLGGRLLCTSRTPLLSAARVLLGEGVPPETILAMRHEGDDIITMRTTVGDAAKLTVVEPDRGSPRFKRWEALSARPAASHSASDGSEAAG